MICPKCQTFQPRSEECSSCGILIAKFKASAHHGERQPVQRKQRTEPVEQQAEANYEPEMEEEAGFFGMLRRLFLAQVRRCFSTTARPARGRARLWRNQLHPGIKLR